MGVSCRLPKSVTMAAMTRQQFLRTLSAGATGFAARHAQAQTAVPQTFTYKTAGCEIRADIYGASEGGTKPALMWIHGGAYHCRCPSCNRARFDNLERMAWGRSLSHPHGDGILTGTKRYRSQPVVHTTS